jgi:hypothetical protein
LRPQPLREIDQWLAPYRALWSEHLDRLAQHLDEMDDDPPRRPDASETEA